MVAMEMRRHNISLLGIAETRWIQTGQFRLSTGELILYSGHTHNGTRHTEGVGFMLSRQAEKALIGWQPVSSRLMTATFKTKQRRILVRLIMCYAPTNEASDEVKNQFYERLKGVLGSNRPQRELTILMGDMNTKIGNCNIGYKEVMGTHGLGDMNNNGERFADLCAEYELVIGGSVIPHKRIHKATWVSPNYTVENQINHFCISRKFRRTLLDVRVMRGADASSDHHLLMGKLQLIKLKQSGRYVASRMKYDINSLKDPFIAQQFCITTRNKYQDLQDMQDPGDSIDASWDSLKKVWTEASEEILGRKKQQSKAWISKHTISKVILKRSKEENLNRARTRLQKERAHAEYTEANKDVKKKCEEGQEEVR